jgi:hypothetical protein
LLGHSHELIDLGLSAVPNTHSRVRSHSQEAHRNRRHTERTTQIDVALDLHLEQGKLKTHHVRDHTNGEFVAARKGGA